MKKYLVFGILILFVLVFFGSLNLIFNQDSADLTGSFTSEVNQETNDIRKSEFNQDTFFPDIEVPEQNEKSSNLITGNIAKQDYSIEFYPDFIEYLYTDRQYDFEFKLNNLKLINYTWYLDGKMLKQNNSLLTIYPEFAGDHTLKLYVQTDKVNQTKKWNYKVIRVN